MLGRCVKLRKGGYGSFLKSVGVDSGHPLSAVHCRPHAKRVDSGAQGQRHDVADPGVGAIAPNLFVNVRRRVCSREAVVDGLYFQVSQGEFGSQ